MTGELPQKPPAIGIQSFAAAELLCRRALGSFGKREQQILDLLIALSFAVGRTEAWFESMTQFIEGSRIDQNHFYGVLNPLLKDSVVKRPFTLCFAIMPPQFWDEDRRVESPRFLAGLSNYNPQKGQLEIFDWPCLDEVIRQNFVQESGIYQGRAGSAGVHSSRGSTGDVPYSKSDAPFRGPGTTGSGERLLPVPAREVRSTSQSGAGSQADRREEGVKPYHQKCGMGLPKENASAFIDVDTTKSVVSGKADENWPKPADTTKSVVSTTKSVVSRSVSVSALVVSVPSQGSSLQGTKAAKTVLLPDTTKSVVSRAELARARATAKDWAAEEEYMENLRQWLSAEEMVGWGGSWRNRWWEDRELAETVLDRLIVRLDNPKPVRSRTNLMWYHWCQGLALRPGNQFQR